MQQAAEVKVGLFVVVVVALGVFIASTLKGGIGGQRGYEFEIWFENAPSVGKGSPVRLAGVDIGEITNKDIIEVEEAVEYGLPRVSTVLPLERVQTWSHRPARGPEVTVEVSRKPVSVLQSRQVRAYTGRKRAVARLTVQVKRSFELYTGYNYLIIGGLVFGDRQLEINDLGPDGLPMSEEARGRSIRDLVDSGQAVAVLGSPPASIDKIVGNVQATMDEDTVARAKRIVENVEEATAQASELVAAMRETVQANQGNADQLMTNLADASEDLKRMMAEAQALAGRTLENVEAVASLARRVAERNEGRANRIMAQVEETTGSFQRMARGSEDKVDRTMTDVAAIAREVRSMIASNRENLDRIAGNVAETTESIKNITGESRQQVASILKQVDESLTIIRRTLDESDERLVAMAADAQALVHDARATVGAVREAVEPISANLRETSENVNTASRNLASLTADPALKQTLGNLEQTTAEARALLGDIRKITADPEVQANLKETTGHVRSVSAKLDQTLGGVASFRPSAFADVYYIPDTSSWVSDLNVAFKLKGTTSVHVGMDNVTRDPVLNAQLGRPVFGDRLRFRYGFYRSQLGLGLDFDPWPNTRLRTDYYNFGDPQVNAKLTWRLPWGMTGLVGVEDAFDRWDWTFGLRFGADLP